MSESVPLAAGTDAPTTRQVACQSKPAVPAAAAQPLRPQWLFHVTWLALPAAALILSLVLEIRNSRQVIVPLINQPLPELCSFRRLTGLDCAGCGLTRCFISISHGRLADAWRYHPAGYLLYALALFQIPWHSVQLWRLSRGQSELRPGKIANGTVFMLAVVLLVVWIVRVWGQVLGW
jgi:Protein of unknown function (DUF2752)